MISSSPRKFNCSGKMSGESYRIKTLNLTPGVPKKNPALTFWVKAGYDFDEVK